MESLAVRWMEGPDIDVQSIGERFVAALAAVGFSQCTLHHARTVWKVALAEAAGRGVDPPTRAALTERSVAAAVIDRVRSTRSADRRLPLVARLYTYLHTGKIEGPTAIPECEWVRNQCRFGAREPAAVPAWRPIPTDPEVDHELARDFLRHLESKGQRWGKRAKYAMRQFLAHLTQNELDFQGLRGVDIDLRRVQTRHLEVYREHLEGLYRNNRISKGTFRLCSVK